MPGKIVLIGCSAKKAPFPTYPRFIYEGNLFRLSLEWAESHKHEWVVVSAFHGLVDQGTVIEPYDLKITDLSKEDRLSWGRRVVMELDAQWETETFVFLAGRPYYDAIFTPKALKLFAGRVETPLAGMGIGQRMSWLKNNKAKVTA